MACHADDWDIQTKLSFAVELATRKVQLEGFKDLVSGLPHVPVGPT